MINNAEDMRAAAIRNKHHKIGYDRAVQSVMMQIMKASEQGCLRTVFNPPTYWYETASGQKIFMEFYDEVKEEFNKKGYKFAPTGRVGGVWQDSEDICW